MSETLDDGLLFDGYIQPPDVPPDPTGNDWRGEPGPVGPPGPQGIPGPMPPGAPFLPLTGGTLTGPLIYTATGGNTPRSAQDRAADVANVLDFGADPTGVLDSAAAINAALATGHDVWIPGGVYRVTHAMTVGAATRSQRLSGDGDATIIQVNSDFDPAALGVFIILPAAGNYAQPNAAIADLRISFAQPADIGTTATLASAVGATSITVASATSIALGQCVVDFTHYDALSNANSATHPVAQMIIVTGIAGNVISLSAPVAAQGVSAGDTLYFGMTRATSAIPGTGTAIPGGTGVRYPWAIYAAAPANGFRLDGIWIDGAWNGVYYRGSAPVWGDVWVGALNIGLDMDACADFGHVDSYKFHAYGWGGASAADQGWARVQSWYDGTTVAANLGKLDGTTFDAILTFNGMINITPNFSWAQIGTAALDGNNANLNILSAKAAWLLIGNMYRTCNAGQATPALNMAPTANMQLNISNLEMACSCGAPAIQVTGGGLYITSGLFWYGSGGVGCPAISLAGDNHSIGQMRLDGGPASGFPYISHTAGGLQISGVYFVQPGAGRVGLAVTDNVRNAIQGNVLNGWSAPSLTLANPLGMYPGWTINTQYVYSTAGNVTARLIAPSGASKLYQIYTGSAGAGSLRWESGAFNDAESGGNAGSTFYIRNYSDTGTQVNGLAPLTIDRPTGLVTLARGAVISGGSSTINGAAIGGSTPAAGAFTSVSLGAVAAPGGVTDLSRHIALYSNQAGFNITASRVNYVAPAGNAHTFVVNAIDVVSVASTGMRVIGNVGFNNTAPVAKPTLSGAWAGNTAGKALSTILANYGLLTDSSSA